MELPDRFALDVTAEDIKNGVSTCAHCPVALAAVRDYSDFIWDVQHSAAYAHGAIDSVKYTHDASDFIERFDLEEPVEPCTVTFTKEAV